jgi:hypothetical protein
MPKPLQLQILGRAVLPKHRHPRVSESVQPGLGDFQLGKKRMKHTLQDVVTADGGTIAGCEHTPRLLFSEVHTQHLRKTPVNVSHPFRLLGFR